MILAFWFRKMRIGAVFWDDNYLIAEADAKDEPVGRGIRIE